jgi:hypothetical protein
VAITELPAAERVTSAAGIGFPPLCVYASGSVVAGWGHATSDLDLFVVAGEPQPVVPPATALRIPAGPGVVPMLTLAVDGGTWDVKVFGAGQVDELVARCEGDPRTRLEEAVVGFLYRLDIAVPISGEAWLRERQRRLRALPFQAMVAAQHTRRGTSLLHDAASLLASDPPSAVVAAREGLGCAVDGLLARYGQLSPGRKWRARRFRLARPAELSWEEYWRLETMRDLDPERPEAWVRAVIDRCGRLE